MSEQEKTPDSLTKQVAWILSAKMLAMVLNLALPLLLVRRLNQESYGLYKQVFLVIGTSVALLPFSFGLTAFYFLPRERESKQAIVINIVLFNFIIGLAAVLVFFFSPELLGNTLIGAEIAARDPNARLQIVALSPVIGAVIFFTLFSTVFENIVMANQESRLASMLIVLTPMSKNLLLVSAAAIFGTVHSLLIAALIQGMLILCGLAWYLQKRFPGYLSSFELAVLKRQIKYAAPYAISGSIWTLQTDMHNYFVSYYFGQTGIAVYSVGVFQLPFIGMLTESVASVMIPRVSYLQSIGDKSEIRRLTINSMRGLGLLILPMYAFLVTMRHDFIVSIFTQTYLASIPIFLIYLTLLPFSIAPLDSIARAFVDVGRFITKMRVFFFFVLAGGLWLTAKRGDLRLVVGTLILVYVTETILTAIRSGRAVEFGAADLPQLKGILKIAFAAGMAGFVTYLAHKSLLPSEWKELWRLMAGGIVFSVTYLLAGLALRIPTDDEKEMAFTKFTQLRAKLSLAQSSI